MNGMPQKFILTADETWQFRRAQSVHEPLAQAVRRVCEADARLRACYFLDARKKGGADVKLVIALSLDDEAKDMEHVVIQLQEVLREFPEITENTVIMSAKRFEQDYSGAEFYVRTAGPKRSTRFLFLVAWLLAAATANAQLAVTISPPKLTGQKAVVALAMRNGLSEKIESARAVVFLLDEQGKMVGQATRWVIGGSQVKPGLVAGATNTFHFVIASDKPFASTNLTAKVNFSRVVLEGGKVADVNKTVHIEYTSK